MFCKATTPPPRLVVVISIEEPAVVVVVVVVVKWSAVRTVTEVKRAEEMLMIVETSLCFRLRLNPAPITRHHIL